MSPARRQLDSTGLKRLHRSWRHRTERRIGLLLDSVQNPVNVGSIVRAAAAYRVDHLWLCGATPPLGAPGMAKTAMGTERYLTVTSLDTAVAGIEAARGDGFTVVGLELAEGAAPLGELDTSEGPVCVVVGHEDHGLSRAALDACDSLAYLPLPGKVGSLNVAMAAAIALYELRRKEWETPGAQPGATRPATGSGPSDE